jgi:hypothetical protein
MRSAFTLRQLYALAVIDDPSVPKETDDLLKQLELVPLVGESLRRRLAESLAKQLNKDGIDVLSKGMTRENARCVLWMGHLKGREGKNTDTDNMLVSRVASVSKKDFEDISKWAKKEADEFWIAAFRVDNLLQAWPGDYIDAGEVR